MGVKEKLNNFILKLKEYVISYYEDLKEISKSGINPFFSKRKISIAISILAIFMLGGYFVGNVKTTESQLYRRLESSLKNGKERALREIIRVNGKEVDKGKLKPLVDYYEGNSEKVNLLMKELKGDGKSTHMEIKNESGLLGSSYYVELKVYNLRVDSNYKEGTIYINDTEQISAGNTLRGLVPGVYTIRGVIEGEFGQIEETQNVVVERDAVTTLNYKASDVTINSPFGDAIVFINGEKTDYTVDEFKDIGPITQDGTVKAHIEKDFPWGKIKSEEYTIKDISNIKIDMEISNDVLIKDVTNVVNGFYESVFSALNEEEKDLITNATSEAVNKVYGIMERKYFILKNKYIVENIELKQENSVYSFEGKKYKATIVADVEYEVSKEFLGFDKERKNNKFFTKLVYENGKWVVENVENFSL
ncbi:MAG: TcaA 3rd/4th domain-containing protein [Clostridium sp.]